MSELNGKKENLEPIPDFDDEFWPKDSDNRILNSKQVSCKDKHKFRHMGKANQVQCECGIGYILTPGMVLKDDHIYDNDTFVI